MSIYMVMLGRFMLCFKTDRKWIIDDIFLFRKLFIYKNYNTEAIQILEIHQNLFPNNTFIQNQLSKCYYNLYEYELSIEYFEKLFQLPLRYEGVDIYSHILFIKDNYCQ